MKLKGKVIKEFFSSPIGILIDRDDLMVFIDCDTKKSKVITKPKDQRNEDDTKKIIFSKEFGSVKTLDDNEEYEIDVVFDAVMFVHRTK
jgi:hypothetical protein